jgi:hypothetical protein
MPRRARYARNRCAPAIPASPRPRSTHVSDEALRRTLERADVLGALGTG